jgi:ubiquinone/menaquinone biosynthesis C-methylase UbiE
MRPTRKLADLLASRLIPARFLASQLRRPSGRFGRWILARGLNDGNAAQIDATLDALAVQDPDHVLDVGFGGGHGLRVASRRTRGRLYGVDFSPDMVARGHRALSDLCAEGRLNLVTADVTDLPLRDSLVDAIITTNTIYFWPDLDAALRELSRVLAPGGRIAFGYSGRTKMEGFGNITRHGFTTFEPPDLERPLDDAGFISVETIPLSGELTTGDYVTVARRPSEG